MKQSIQVVMLPTLRLKIGDLCTSLRHGKKPLIFGEFENSYLNECKGQHLHITVSQDVEFIKEDDWCININKDTLYQPNCKGDLSGWRKIIATTDTKLTIFNTIDDRTLYLPQLQQLFIKEFVANPKGEWEVEYDIIHADRALGGFEYFIKLNQDNTITLIPTEKKIYSKKEVKSLIHLFYDAFCYGIGNEIEKYEWIKENL